MFFYTADFTSPAFFPSNLFHRDQDCLKIFTSKNRGRKCPPHAKLLACGIAVMQQLIFYAAACKSVFYVLSQEANEHFLYVVSSYCKAANDGNNLHKDVSTNHCNMLPVDCEKQ
jgi:hypothetical protein